MSKREQVDEGEIRRLAEAMIDPEKRYEAIARLCDIRYKHPHFAHAIWFTPRSVWVTLSDIIELYPLLENSTTLITEKMMRHACLCIAIWKTFATHADVREAFVSSHLVAFLYPYMSTTAENRTLEYLKYSSLGVVVVMLQTQSPTVIDMLLSTDYLNICYRMMRFGSLTTKKLATTTLAQILTHNHGLMMLCASSAAVHMAVGELNCLTMWLVLHRDKHLVRLVVTCYERLTYSTYCREYLRTCLPSVLLDHTFVQTIQMDKRAKEHHINLLHALGYELQSPTNIQGFPFG